MAAHAFAPALRRRAGRVGQPWAAVHCRFQCSARSANCVKPNDTSATSAAPPSSRDTLSVRCETRRIWHSLRRASRRR
ncbi:Uncharacterised protein [Bordetella pertussis]|nr:Uncharacterised protein [Bordetella pertussis]